MKIDEITKLIRFSERENAFGDTVLYGKIEVGSAVTISQHVPDFREIEKQAKEMVKSLILEKLYDDQRRDIAIAICELQMCHPMEFQKQQKATEAIMKAARYTPPE